MTADFTTFDQFQRIDSRNPKGSETNGRVEMLLASGDQGPDWKFIQSTIPLKGRTEIQVWVYRTLFIMYFCNRIKPADRYA